MNNVYIVKSGSLVDFTGWEWLNLRAFTDYDKAEALCIDYETAEAAVEFWTDYAE